MSSLGINGSFDGLAPSDRADIEVVDAVIEAMIVARFVVLAQVGVVVDGLRVAFFDLRCQQVAEALIGSAACTTVCRTPLVIYVVPTGSRAASVAPGANLTA
jgi:hypothetical protein